MIPDIEQMTIIELERFLIERSERIRNMGGNKITKTVIAKAIGCLHDELQTKALYKKLKRVKCMERSGAYYKIKVDKIVDPDIDAIHDDEQMSLMDNMFDDAMKVSKRQDIELMYSDDIPGPCRFCLFFEEEDGKNTCGNRGEETDPDDTCESFKVDLKKMKTHRHMWYKKKGKKSG